jgi:putative DNA primase/helicase
MITNVKNIPDELKELKQWVCWTRDNKVPRDPHTGGNAKANDAATWGTLVQAVEACEKYGFDGVGFEFAPPYFGVDLDHCLDDLDFVDEFVETLQSYTEYSRSHSGIHIICRGELPTGGRRKNNVEMYSEGRYFICTGDVYNDKYRDIRDCTEAVKVLHSKYIPQDKPQTPQRRDIQPVSLDDREILEKACACQRGDLFASLYAGSWQGIYASQSSADLALCNRLAFWTQCDAEQIDRLFRASGLYRKKWDERRGQMTYGQLTITRAIDGCAEVYQPRIHGDGTNLAFALFGDHVQGQSKEGYNAPQGVATYDMTDTGNAHRLHDRYGNIIRYSYNRKRWLYWDGKRWRIDDGAEIKRLADDIIQDIKKDAAKADDEKERDTLWKWATRTANSKGKEAMIKECQHLEGVPVSTDELDAYGEYLNCNNGVVNLATGELLPHDASMMHSKICLCDYDAENARPEKWLKFLSDVTNNNTDLMRYIQKCVGYSLSGSIEEQCAYFLYGMGNNGKSTFLDTIADMMGDYAANAQPDTIMCKKFGGDGANSDIARLKSARFVTCEEPTEGVRLNEGLLKQLTGGSKVTCRFLYGEEFEYTPEFKIWVATNHKPVIRGTDLGIWRRIKLIPFEVNIPKEKVDKNLRYKLREELPQILAWAVEGYQLWRSEGMQEPQSVLDAVKEYKQEMDLLATFAEQCLVIDYNYTEKYRASDLFHLYSCWAKANNEYEMSSKKFFTEIAKKVPEKSRDSKGIFFAKIKPTEYAEELVHGRQVTQYRFNDFN